MNTHRDVFIVLKKSLKWVPVVGWVRFNIEGVSLGLISNIGNANVPIHIPKPFMGFGSVLPVLATFLAWAACRGKRHPSYVHFIS